VVAPANDNLANAQVVVSDNYFSADSTDATVESGETRPAANGTPTTAYRTMWYRWTAGFTGQATVDTNATWDTVIGVYKAKSGVTDPVASFANLDLVAYNDDDPWGGIKSSLATFTATTGVVYYVQVSGAASTEFGPYYLFGPSPRPANDQLADAIDLTGTQVTGNAFGASSEFNEVSGTASLHRSVWYRWTAPSSANATFSTIGSTYDTILTVWKASAGQADPVTNVANLDYVAADDDSGGSSTSLLTITPVSGKVYYLQVSSYYADPHVYTLNYPVPASTGGSQAGAAALTAASSLTAAASGTVAGAATLTAASSVTAVASRGQAATVAMSAASSVTAGPTRVQSGAVAMTAVSALSTAATRVQPAASTMTAVSAVTAGATRNQSGAVAMTAATSMTTTATVTTSGTVTMTAATGLTTAATPVRPGTTTMSSVSALTAAAPTVTKPGAATLTAVTSLTASATNSGTQSLFTTQTPATFNNDNAPYTLGTVITPAVAGTITAGRWYFPTSLPTGTTTFVLYDYNTQTELARQAFTNPTGGAWNTTTLTTQVTVTAGQTVVACVFTPDRYVSTSGFFNTALTNGDLTGPATTSIGNGRFRNDIDAYPSDTFGAASYFVDMLFVASSDLGVTMSAASTFTSAPFTVSTGAVTMNAATTLTADAVRVMPAAVVLAASSSLNTTAAATRAGAVAMSAGSAMAVAGTPVRFGASTMTAASGLTAAGFTTQTATAPMTAASALTATAATAPSGGVALTAATGLTVVAVMTTSGANTMTAGSDLTIAAFVTRPATTAMTAVSGLTAVALGGNDGAATLSTASNLQAAATATRFGTVSLGAATTLTTAGTTAPGSSAPLTALTNLVAAGVANTQAAAVMTAITALTAAATGGTNTARRPGILVAGTRRSHLVASTVRGTTYTTGSSS
jgi:hypothetical protein